MTLQDQRPVIWWVRRDLRLSDNPVLTAALSQGAPVVPVFILDEVFEQWRDGVDDQGHDEERVALDACVDLPLEMTIGQT